MLPSLGTALSAALRPSVQTSASDLLETGLQESRRNF